jgi:3-keto-5-aminohexanoate cleavage enzyme
MGNPAPVDHPVIIEVAINGLTSKARNPNVPIEPAEIAADALACIEAGAAIVHNHIDGMAPTAEAAAERYLEGWRPVLAERPDALLYPTVHIAGGGISYEHQVPLAEAGAIRIGLVDPGSVNLGGVDGDGVPSGGFVYANSFDTIERAFTICREHRLGPNLAIYEPGFLRAVRAWEQAGRLPAGALAKLYFATEQGYMGAPFGLPPTITALDAYAELLDGSGVAWAASVVGGDLVASEVARAAIERGGHLHVGLEFFAGGRTPTNVELVQEAVALVRGSGKTVASPAEAAELLGLPQPIPAVG